MQPRSIMSPRANSLLTGKLTGNFVETGPAARFGAQTTSEFNGLQPNPVNGTGNFCSHNREIFSKNREFKRQNREFVSIDFSHTCFLILRTRSVLTGLFASEEERDGGRMAVSRALRRALLAGAPRGMASERVESARVLRGSGDLAQGVRQLAGEVQSRAAAAGAQAALPS